MVGILVAAGLGGSMGTLVWKPVAPGVWQAQVGRRDLPTLMTAAGGTPAKVGLEGLGRGLAADSGSSGMAAGGFASARIPIEPSEKIYGLGLQMHGLNRRDGIYRLRVDHYSSGNERLHAPVPLYVSSRGYAVLFDTSRPITVSVGIGNQRGAPNPPARDRNTDPAWDAQPFSGAVEASVQGPGLTIYWFEGPTPMQAVQRYNLFCGGGAMPPRWALGFWHRTPSLADQNAVSSEVSEFEKRGFPIDVIGLEPGWQSSSYPCTFEWSAKRFPNPGRFVKDMSVKGVRVNLWTNPYVSEKSPIYEALEGHFGSHMVWLGAVPDMMQPAAQKTLTDYFQNEHLRIGVSGYKIDEVDGFDNWLWPDHAAFPSGLSGVQMRQVYGLLWQRTLEDLYRKEGRRSFGLVRGSNAGSSRFPYAIYSDTYDHREYLTGMISTGFAGVLWCAEARDAANGEEWVRRMQTAAVSHIAQLNAWASGTKPWSFPGFEDAVRSAMRLRIQLVPYLYTAFAKYHFEGLPVIRPMALVDGGQEMDQFLLGDDLLAAPMLTGQRSRKVRLPKGRWFDFHTGVLVGSGETIEVQPGLETIPLFVRDGALIPALPTGVKNASYGESEPFEVRRYGAAHARGWLYDDDGTSFAYEQGAYAMRELQVGTDGALVSNLKSGKPSLGGRKLNLRAMGGT
ncbi:MAG: DUF5110 domain-containing protein [Armatimonadetes bacterium]|nr:DUF5110 domain-containing protein [Armatimonadota bacterium]